MATDIPDFGPEEDPDEVLYDAEVTVREINNYNTP